eukprot:CAMPEP_0117619010 /NCGR_PEP_ID=MMETSP0784-20121206/86400_1 /TAXON_ID=39447 /ORGANISM="" /LENGTH=673 /DNA_ID=CAMNT_0005422895 /DNA_START=42 /DNA_END=2064 /DNA_ORIENTATION=-
MAGPTHVDPAIGNFQDDVDKSIVTEAASDAWHRPSAGDMVTVEVQRENEGAKDAAYQRTWTVGCGPAAIVAGLDLDRCVRTMRQGEESLMKLRDAVEGDSPRKSLRLRLLALERTEDLLGDGKLTRITVHDGAGTQTPQPGTELKVRFSWRTPPIVAPAAGLDATDPTDSAASTRESCRIQLSSGNAEADPAYCHALRNLQRDLLSRCRGEVVTYFDAEIGALSEPRVLSITRGDVVLVDNDQGLSVADAHATLQDAVLASRDAKWLQLASKKAVWIPGVAGLRVLSDLREGQRCLIRVAPDLAFGNGGRPDLGIPPGAIVEYDVELLCIMTLEDVSFEKNRSAMKKVTRKGEGYERPTEGLNVQVRVEAREDTGGAVLLEERELSFKAASGSYCTAIDETVLTMKKGEICEVRCLDPGFWSDKDLGLDAILSSSAVIVSLELLSFDKLDLYGGEEADRVAHCSARKEVGTRFFLAAEWRRSLKRYQFVTSTLAYVDHWKEEDSKMNAINLRRLCHLNAAACLLKLEAWRDAQKSCDAVLMEEAHNVKALFRRGQALMELRDFNEAERSFKKVRDIEPENKAAVRMLLKVRQSLKEEVGQQKEMFSRMAKAIGTGDGGQGAAPAEKAKEPGKAAPDGDGDNEQLSWMWVGAAAMAVVLAGAALGATWLRRRRQ